MNYQAQRRRDGAFLRLKDAYFGPCGEGWIDAGYCLDAPSALPAGFHRGFVARTHAFPVQEVVDCFVPRAQS